MNFGFAQNPGIGGLDELTTTEELFVQNVSALSDPNADRILFWDDSAGSYQYLSVGTGLSISGTTLSSSARVPTVVTQSATPTINTSVTSVAHITGLAQAITSFTTNLSGTNAEGDSLRIDITDNGTARAITWGSSFEASTVALPTTTVISTRLDIGFFWNTVTSKWRCVAVA